MRFLFISLTFLLATGAVATAADAEKNDADDIVILSVQPRDADVKPVVVTLPMVPSAQRADRSHPNADHREADKPSRDDRDVARL